MNRITDPAMVWPIWGSPSINPFVTDDFSEYYPMPEIVSSPNVVCLMPAANDAYFIFIFQRPMLVEVHAAVLTSARSYSVEYAKAAAKWMFDNTPCRTILSFVPKGNYPALALDRAVGFKKVGIVPKCNPKGGILGDMTLMCLNAEI